MRCLPIPQVVKGRNRLEIPLFQLGNYLEFAGYFISIRSGLCDIAEHSHCKQIVIFREQRVYHCSVLEYFDLHKDNLSEESIYCIYDEEDFCRNVDFILEVL